MLFQFTLSQTNAKGQQTFRVSKKENVGQTDDVLLLVPTIASFIFDTIQLVKDFKKLGYNGIKGIRKSQQLKLIILSLDEDDDTEILLELPSFSKFVHCHTQKQVEKFITTALKYIERNQEIPTA